MRTRIGFTGGEMKEFGDEYVGREVCIPSRGNFYYGRLNAVKENMAHLTPYLIGARNGAKELVSDPSAFIDVPLDERCINVLPEGTLIKMSQISQEPEKVKQV